MQFLRHFWNIAVDLDSGAAALDEGARVAICRPDALIVTLNVGGRSDVRCEPIEIETRFASFEDFWLPFLAGTGPAPPYVATLEEDHRQRLAQQLAQALDFNSDGAFAMTARAWAVRGTACTTR